MSAKKIVLINQHTAYLFIDIANAFAQEYDEVVLMAGIIHPLGTELNPKIKVHKIVPYDKKNTFTRITSWFIGFFQSWFGLVFRYRQHEVYLSSNPPFAAFLPLLLKRKCSLLVFDLYPDFLLTSGTVSNSDHILYKAWQKLNVRAFRKLHSVATITSTMASRIAAYTDRGIPVVPLWIDGSLRDLHIRPQDNQFFKEHHLAPDKFYVIYSGNLGKGHSVEVVVDLARALQHRSDLGFVIAGEGFKQAVIEEKLAEHPLDNIIVLPYQDRAVFRHLLAGTSIGVVTIDEPSALVSIPSKVFNLFAAAKPILCIGPAASDLADLVHEHGAGKSFKPEQISEMCNFILELLEQQSLYAQYSGASLRTSQDYLPENARTLASFHWAD